MPPADTLSATILSHIAHSPRISHDIRYLLQVRLLQSGFMFKSMDLDGTSPGVIIYAMRLAFKRIESANTSIVFRYGVPTALPHVHIRH